MGKCHREEVCLTMASKSQLEVGRGRGLGTAREPHYFSATLSTLIFGGPGIGTKVVAPVSTETVLLFLCVHRFPANGLFSGFLCGLLGRFR